MHQQEFAEKARADAENETRRRASINDVRKESSKRVSLPPVRSPRLRHALQKCAVHMNIHINWQKECM